MLPILDCHLRMLVKKIISKKLSIKSKKHVVLLFPTISNVGFLFFVIV